MSESMNEANIGLADLEEIGYTDGDKAVAMHFNQDVVGINMMLITNLIEEDLFKE